MTTAEHDILLGICLRLIHGLSQSRPEVPVLARWLTRRPDLFGALPPVIVQTRRGRVFPAGERRTHRIASCRPYCRNAVTVRHRASSLGHHLPTSRPSAYSARPCASRMRRFLTVETCQRPPRRVRMPRALSSPAMARSE